MQSLAPEFTVSRNDEMREIHWSAAGLWTEEKLVELQKELLEISKPFREERLKFHVLGDLRELSVQPKEMADKMRQTQQASAALGVTRMAIVITSVLVKQQMRRLCEAFECEFFDSRADAIAWLRRDA